MRKGDRVVRVVDVEGEIPVGEYGYIVTSVSKNVSQIGVSWDNPPEDGHNCGNAIPNNSNRAGSGWYVFKSSVRSVKKGFNPF